MTKTNYYIISKPDNVRKRHKVSLTDAKRLFKQKVKEFPLKTWILEDDNSQTLECTLDNETFEPKQASSSFKRRTLEDEMAEFFDGKKKSVEEVKSEVKSEELF